ncbi:PUA-like domain-containing protein [Roridomyces roridus]|uniref:PUA-like domain-containing protein n=1 Tax=Roridomyces roridus TaxID=1738132 RepID=A0AAD7CJ80_9AGAR|nr:PUA-like domain-containing protein [Roridomyces roridus]
MDVDVAVAPEQSAEGTESGHGPHGRRAQRPKAPKLVRKEGIDPNTHDHIPGVPVLTTFVNRQECSEKGVHAPNWKGIHGQKDGPAFSVVLSGGYEDDNDKGDTFVYTGEGGRSDKNTKGKKTQAGSGPQVRNQEWTGGNKSLQLSQISGAVGKSGFHTCQFTFERLPGQPPIPTLDLPPRKPKIIKARPTARRNPAPACARVKKEPLSDDEGQLGSGGPSASGACLLGKRKREDEDEEEDIKPSKWSKEGDEDVGKFWDDFHGVE